MPEPHAVRTTLKFNFQKFILYLGSVFLSLTLAPALAFIISFVAHLFSKSSVALASIFWECLYVDTLVSILTICVMITFSSEYKAQKEIKRCLGRPSKIYAYLRRICQLLLLLLFVLEIYYKANQELPIQNSLIYNTTESVSLCICIVTQCLSHPRAYFCP